MRSGTDIGGYPQKEKLEPRELNPVVGVGWVGCPGSGLGNWDF